MLTCDARMTSEVHNCFHEKQRNWSLLLKARTVVAAIAVCVLPPTPLFPVLKSRLSMRLQPDYKCVGKSPLALERKLKIEIRKYNGPDWARTSDPALIKRML